MNWWTDELWNLNNSTPNWWTDEVWKFKPTLACGNLGVWKCGTFEVWKCGISRWHNHLLFPHQVWKSKDFSSTSLLKIRVPLYIKSSFFFGQKKAEPFSRFLRAHIIFFAQIFRIVQDGSETLKSGVFWSYPNFGGTSYPHFAPTHRKFLKFSEKSLIWG